MVIMAVDYGDVRTGIAVCDKLEMLASPVCVITQRDPEKLIKEITEIAANTRQSALWSACRRIWTPQ